MFESGTRSAEKSGMSEDGLLLSFVVACLTAFKTLVVADIPTHVTCLTALDCENPNRVAM